MDISMNSVKELREKSGAGMVDCKKALEESSGNIETAMELLRKKGILKAAKRCERDASEGIIKVAVNEDAKKGYIAQLNAETDFVSRSEKFQEFAKDVFELIVEFEPGTLEELFQAKMSDGNTVKENLESLSGVIGEKLAIERFDIIRTQGAVGAYSHLGGKIGTLVAIDSPDAKQLAYELAMQVSAANPVCISRENVPAEDLEKEKNIYREQLKAEGKPENMIENIMAGKLNKYYSDICLNEQEYIKDDKKKVKDILEGATIENFVRYSL